MFLFFWLQKQTEDAVKRCFFSPAQWFRWYTGKIWKYIKLYIKFKAPKHFTSNIGSFAYKSIIIFCREYPFIYILYLLCSLLSRLFELWIIVWFQHYLLFSSWFLSCSLRIHHFVTLQTYMCKTASIFLFFFTFNCKRFIGK